MARLSRLLSLAALVLLVTSAGFPLSAAAAGGTFTVDGQKTSLPFVYAFETRSDFSSGNDITLLFANHEMNAATMKDPLKFRQDMADGSIILVAIGIDRDKNAYSLELHHPIFSPGLAMAASGTGQMALDLKKFGAAKITGTAGTAETKKTMGHEWTFNGSFDLKPTPLATASAPRDALAFAGKWLGPGDKAWARLTVDGTPVALDNVYAQSETRPGDKDKRETTILFTAEPFKSDGVHSLADLHKALLDSKADGVLITLDDTKTAYSGEIFHPAFSPGIAISGSKQFDFQEAKFADDSIDGRLSSQPQTSAGHKWSFDSVFVSEVRDLSPKGTPLPADGGAPGKAYLAYLKIFQKGDMKALRDAVSADRAKQMDDPDFKQMFAMIKEMAPKQVKIKGGLIDGARATLNVTGQVMGSMSDGVVTMIMEGKKWKVAREAWGDSK